MRKNYHPLGTCVDCQRDGVRMMCRGRCCKCYRDFIERDNPEARERRLEYMRQWQRKNKEYIHMPDERDIIRIIIYPPIFTIEDWLSFICQGRKRNKRTQPETRPGAIHKQTPREDACIVLAS
jgi:hypothetical protein